MRCKIIFYFELWCYQISESSKFAGRESFADYFQVVFSNSGSVVCDPENIKRIMILTYLYLRTWLLLRSFFNNIKTEKQKQFLIQSDFYQLLLFKKECVIK